MLLLTIGCEEAPYVTARAKVLESGTITYIDLNQTRAETLLVGDTVWLDLDTHIINDTGSCTMKAVILPKP